MKQIYKKRLAKAFIILGIVFFAYKTLAFWGKDEQELFFEDKTKSITINENGLIFKTTTSADNLSELLREKDIILGFHDQITPQKENKIYPGSSIEIKRALKIVIQADGKKIDGYAFGKTVQEALQENNVKLGRLDKTTPEVNSIIQNNANITVTRINIEEITQKEDIDFKIITKTDNKMGWRDKEVETPGEKGTKEVRYRVTYKNNKEISREIISKTITQEPQPQTEIHGTFVKIGKKHTGQGTWYAFKGGLYAASPWLPMGSFAKVTNNANGKSVIVEINDRGPFGDGRIIDLDKVAFGKIASLGAGVIDVKVEEILN